jgi:glycosyltransferase involved in cell wall biosynthesis
MNIVHHVTDVSPRGGGMRRAALDLTRILARAGHEVTLLAAGDEEVVASLPRDGEVRSVWLEPASGRLDYLSRADLDRADAVLGAADVVHLHGLWQPRNTQLLALAQRRNLPCVVSAHGMLNRWALRHHRLRKWLWYQFAEKRYLAGARIIHVTAERERQDACRLVNAERLRVIPLALDLQPYQDPPAPPSSGGAAPCLDEGLPSILFVGRLHPVKRVELLIESLALLRRRDVPCQLLIAGEGTRSYARYLETVARRHDVADRIRLLGHVGGREKRALYRRARLVALPSLRENFAFVVFESLAHGTPAIITRGVDTWREISGSGGVCVADATPDAFAEAIGDLLSNRERCRQMGRAGREWTFRWLAPEALVDGYVAMYREAARTG